MRRAQAQRHHTVQSSERRASAHRVVHKRSRPARAASRTLGPKRVVRGRSGHGRNRRSRRPLLFFVLVASVAAQLAAVFANSGALVALITLVGLLLCAVVIRAED